MTRANEFRPMLIRWEHKFLSKANMQKLSDYLTKEGYMTPRLEKSDAWTYLRPLRDTVPVGLVSINNPADLLTKPLSRTQLRHLFRILRRLAWGGDPDSSNTPHGSKPKQLKRAPHDSASAKLTVS
ncbi:hypothetical protein NFJ02_32g81830 [Pycnococcus provasolii]